MPDEPRAGLEGPLLEAREGPTLGGHTLVAHSGVSLDSDDGEALSAEASGADLPTTVAVIVVAAR
jgi:hypothetical protein